MKNERSARNLYMRRVLNELTREEVEDATRTSQGSLSRWENGKNVPDLLEGEQLATLYKCSKLHFLEPLQDLLGDGPRVCFSIRRNRNIIV